jgi:hypothetical protein
MLRQALTRWLMNRFPRLIKLNVLRFALRRRWIVVLLADVPQDRWVLQPMNEPQALSADDVARVRASFDFAARMTMPKRELTSRCTRYRNPASTASTK